jgi:hypothetical protein
MWLSDLTIKGYLGCDFDRGMELRELGHLNVLIGPNNSGKSIPFRFMLAYCDLFKNRPSDEFTYFYNIESPQLTPVAWHQQDTSKWLVAAVRVTLKDQDLLGYPSSLGGHKLCLLNSLQSGCKDIEVEFRVAWLNAIPHIYINPLIQVTHDRTSWFWTFSERLGDPDYEIDQTGVDVPGRRDLQQFGDGPQYVRSLHKRLRFFDPTRAIISKVKAEQESAGSTNLIDGTQSILKLKGLKKSGLRGDSDLVRQVFKTINQILSNGNQELLPDLDVAERADGYTLSFSGSGGETIDLTNAGTGIAAIVCLVAEVLIEKEPRIFFLEEPELHLHPGLLARLVSFLRSCTKHQFIISSHSNALLDCLGKEDNVYRVFKTARGNSQASICREFTDFHITLDTLGIRPTSLLQVNTIVWVEGPSDIVYLRFLLEQFSKHLPGGALVENSDFAFCMYGGSNLQTLCADESDPENQELVSILRICRRAVLIGDRDSSAMEKDRDDGNDLDIPPDEALLKAAVRKIKAEFELDKVHRLFCTSDGREIENDIFNVSKEVFVNALKAGFPIRLKSLSSERLVPSDSARLPYFIASAADGSDDRAKSFQNSFNKKKFKLAQLWTKEIELSIERNEACSLPTYLASVIDFIASGRDTEKL